MHRSYCVKCVAWLLAAAIFCSGSMVSAAGSDQKAQTVKADATGQSASEVLARVNGAEIKAIELQRAKKVIMSGQPGMQIPPERQKEFEQQSLSQLISAELLYQAGQKLVVRDIDKKIEDRIAQSKGRFSNADDFAKAIKALDMDEAELREYTRKDMIIANFIEQTIAPKITVSEEESKKFYDQNLEKFKRDEAVRASHILCGVDSEATAEEKKKAREKAEKLRKELANGADFAKLARENSTCPSSQQGGDLGYFSKGQMVPSFEQAAFALKPGEMSDIVETRFGYHIIKTTDKKEAETVPFKEARPRIEEYLKGQKVTADVNAYLAEARKNGKIELLSK